MVIKVHYRSFTGSAFCSCSLKCSLNRCRFTNRQVTETACVTGRESGISFQEQISRLPTDPLSRRSPSWPSRHRLGGALASSSGSYQSKLEEHMLAGTALCVQPLFSQQQNKAGPWQEAYEALIGGTRTLALRRTSLPPEGTMSL